VFPTAGGSASQGCVDVVAIGHLTPVHPTGWCGPELSNDEVFAGQVSPDGNWVEMRATGESPGVLLARTSDLHAGRWEVTHILPPAAPGLIFTGWDSAATFSVRTVLPAPTGGAPLPATAPACCYPMH